MKKILAMITVSVISISCLMGVSEISATTGSNENNTDTKEEYIERIEKVYEDDNTFITTIDGEEETVDFTDKFEEDYTDGNYDDMINYIESNDLIIVTIDNSTVSTRAFGMINAVKIATTRTGYGTVTISYILQCNPNNISNSSFTWNKLSGSGVAGYGHDTRWYKNVVNTASQYREVTFRPYIKYTDGTYYYLNGDGKAKKIILTLYSNTNNQPTAKIVNT